MSSMFGPSLRIVQLALFITGGVGCARDFEGVRPGRDQDDDGAEAGDADDDPHDMDSGQGDGDEQDDRDAQDATAEPNHDAGISQGAVCGGRYRTPCPEGEYCFFAANCGGLADPGVCKPKPDCAPVWEPVCGCDYRTYANEGCAAQAGVGVGIAGPCDLDNTQFCDVCDIPDEMPQPLPCPDGMPPQFACVVTKAGACQWQRLPCPGCDDRPLDPGQCWTDDDCLGSQCAGAQCCQWEQEGPEWMNCDEINEPGECM